MPWHPMQVYATLAPRPGSPPAAAIVGWMMTAATIEASASARERMSMSLQNSRKGSVRRAAMLMMVQGKFHPWMGLALAILAGAALLVLLLRRPEDSGTRSSPPVAEIGQPAPSVVQSAEKPPTAPIPGDTTAREVQQFQRRMRRTILANHAWLMTPAARELFLAGHPREAAERNQLDLAARYEEGDRDAAATLYSLVANCRDSEVAAARSGAAEGYASLAAQARERANQRFGLAKA